MPHPWQLVDGKALTLTPPAPPACSLLPALQARSGKLKARALRHLASEELGLVIQEGEHSPVDDARAALYLYMKHRKEWERWMAQGGKHHQHPATQAAAAAAAVGGKLGAMVASGGNAGKHMSLEELAKNAEHLADL